MLTLPRCFAQFVSLSLDFPGFKCNNAKLNSITSGPICTRQQQFHQQSQISFIIALCSRFISIMASTLLTSFNMRQFAFNDDTLKGQRIAEHILFKLAS